MRRLCLLIIALANTLLHNLPVVSPVAGGLLKNFIAATSKLLWPVAAFKYQIYFLVLATVLFLA